MEFQTIESSEKQKIESRKRKIKLFAKIIFYFLIFLFTAFLAFSFKATVSNQESESWISKIPILRTIKNLVESAGKELKGEENDRINILLLGMGGKNHEGGYLTDTIILASLQPSTKKVAMFSIPRDLAIPMENKGWRKINNVNAYAEAQKAGSGGVAASQAISDVLNIPIDYYLRVDFEGFTNIVDELGGIKIYVENVIDDYSYPIPGREEAEPYESRFEHLYIEKGWQEMNGDLALKYVRSRHSSGIEGSDFSRAKRQQKVIEAVKENFLSVKYLFKPKTIANIIEELDNHVSTNLKIWEITKLWDIFKDTKKENIINKTLDNTANGLLTAMMTPEGAYILAPASGDFTEIQYMVNNIFSDAPAESKTKVATEKATVEVRNGTWINGLASKTALDLEKYGFEIARIGNSSQQNFQKSVIYDLTYGEKLESLTILKEKTNANISYSLPQWLIDDIAQELAKDKNTPQPDFILIIGKDADNTSSGMENTTD